MIIGLLAVGASVLITNAWSTKAGMCRYAEANGSGSSSSCVFYEFADGIKPYLLIGGGVMAVIGGLVTLGGLGLGVGSLFKSSR